MNYSYNYGYDYGAVALSPAYIAACIVSMLYSLVCMWLIYRKAGEHGWAVLVPFYNLYVLFKITWGKGVKFLLLLIPVANVVIAIITIVKLAKVFGKGGGFAVGLLFLAPIFMGILAFGKAVYVGVQGANPAAAAAGYQNPYSQTYQNPYAGNQTGGYQNPYAGSQTPGYQNPYAQPQGGAPAPNPYGQPQNYAQPDPYAQPAQDPYGQTRQNPYAQPQSFGQPAQSYWQGGQETAAQPAAAARTCPYCGTALPEGAAFCTACGAKQN